jgi:hypothetical protein
MDSRRRGLASPSPHKLLLPYLSNEGAAIRSILGGVRRLSLILRILICGLPALAQSPHFSFGAMGGARLSRGAPGRSSHEESRLYAIGPAFEVSFGEHLAVELNALYRRFGNSHVSAMPSGLTGGIGAYLSTRTRAHGVEFPILGKYYFGRRNPRGRFFVATGYAFQRSWTKSTYEVLPTSPPSGGSVGVLGAGGSGAPTVVGAAFGAGVARKMGPLSIAPAFRYTHWGFRTDGASRNQIEILLGVWF